jgi:hypothetical protein
MVKIYFDYCARKFQPWLKLFSTMVKIFFLNMNLRFSFYAKKKDTFAQEFIRKFVCT